MTQSSHITELLHIHGFLGSNHRRTFACTQTPWPNSVDSLQRSAQEEKFLDTTEAVRSLINSIQHLKAVYLDLEGSTSPGMAQYL